MHTLAPGQRQFTDERLADLLLHEQVVGRVIGRELLDQMAAFGRFERIEQVVLLGARHGGERVERERAADDGRRRQHLAVLGCEQIESTAQNQSHTLRHFGVTDLEPGAPPAVVVEQPSAVAQVPEQLLGEERVAVRLGEHEIDQLGRRVASGASAEHGTDLVDRQQSRPEIHRANVTVQRADGRGQRSVGLQLVVAKGADDQQRETRRSTGLVTQQQQRRLVGPVQVLVDEHHRLVVRRPFDELSDAMQHVAALLLRCEVRRRRDVVVSLAQRR